MSNRRIKRLGLRPVEREDMSNRWIKRLGLRPKSCAGSRDLLAKFSRPHGGVFQPTRQRSSEEVLDAKWVSHSAEILRRGPRCDEEGRRNAERKFWIMSVFGSGKLRQAPISSLRRKRSRVDRDKASKDWTTPLMLRKSGPERSPSPSIDTAAPSVRCPVCMQRSDESESALTITCAMAAYRRLYQARHKMPPRPLARILRT